MSRSPRILGTSLDTTRMKFYDIISKTSQKINKLFKDKYSLRFFIFKGKRDSVAYQDFIENLLSGSDAKFQLNHLIFYLKFSL